MGQDDPLVFMSDASAEAGRLMSALKGRGYNVVDVALHLLVGRVSVQKPSLILCDVDAAGALDQVRRLRDVPGGSGVDIVFFGEAGRTLDELRDEVFHEGSGFFVRPVDAFGLVRKVEALIGPPSKPGELPPPTKYSSRPPREKSGPPPPPAAEPSKDALPSAPASSPPERDSSRPPLPSSPVISSSPFSSSSPPSPNPSPLPGRPSSTPPELSLPRPIPLGFSREAESGVLARHIPQSEMSPELESILARAEQRLGAMAGSGSNRAPQSERMSPEEEVDAVLPADVLAALDEPLDDVDDEAERPEAGTGTGRGTSTGGARTGYGATGSGPGTNVGTGAGVVVTGGTSADGSLAGPTTAPPRRPDASYDDNAPKTPPAMEPPSWPPPAASSAALTAVEAKPVSSLDREPSPASRTVLGNLRPTPLPPAPTPTSIHLPRTPEASPSSRPPPRIVAPVEIPSVLGPSDAPLAVARLIRARFTGALAFENEAGIRRIVLRDGDFVTASSGVASESLIHFLSERGVLTPEVVRGLGHKLPPFGRHAGAALIAHGHLRQDELWPVLRSHAEWIVGRVVVLTSGGASMEREIPQRLLAEPAVFGGATGAEVFVEIVRRVIAPEQALARLGGNHARLMDGPSVALLGECALGDRESELVTRAKSTDVGEALRVAERDFAAVLYALVSLGILEAVGASAEPALKREQRVEYDALDEQALRSRILARRALVNEGDYFALLGLPRSATSYDVQRAYQELKTEFEPSRILTASTADLRDDVDLIREILDEAYEILRDQLRRDRYRRALEAAPH